MELLKSGDTLGMGAAHKHEYENSPVQIKEDALYSSTYLRACLPPPLLHAVFANCKAIDGWYHGEAIQLVLRGLLSDTKLVATNENDRPQYPTVTEAAAALNMDPATLRRKVNAGLIEYIDLARNTGGNRDIRFSWAALEKFVQSCTVGPHPLRPAVGSRSSGRAA